jgi:hypothetical protein
MRTYDKEQYDSEGDYFAFSAWLENKTADGLVASRGNTEAVKQTIVDYLE